MVRKAGCVELALACLSCTKLLTARREFHALSSKIREGEVRLVQKRERRQLSQGWRRHHLLLSKEA